MATYIPNWQRNFHIITELGSVAYIPWIWSASNQVDNPHRWRLRTLVFAIILIDGGLAFRWWQLRKKSIPNA